MSDKAYFEKRVMIEVERRLNRRAELLRVASEWRAGHNATAKKAVEVALDTIATVDRHFEPPTHDWHDFGLDIHGRRIVMKCRVCKKQSAVPMTPKQVERYKHVGKTGISFPDASEQQQWVLEHYEKAGQEPCPGQP